MYRILYYQIDNYNLRILK